MEKTHGKPSLNRIYLDYNASTPIAPEVAKEIQSFLVDRFGNPSANHWASHSLQETIHQSRESVALLLGCNPEEIVFTSGASEANNQALKGVFFGRQRRGNHIIATKIEHPSVLEACRFLERVGAQVTYLEVDEFGLVSPEDVEKAITDQTILISIMHANNEVGTIQPISEISRIARKHGIYLHSDAAQSVGKIPVNVHELGVDLLSVAGHKFYAPKGIGALYIRSGVVLESLIHGAGHESGRRAGTENVPYIAGLGKAAELAAQDLSAEHLKALGQYFWNELKNHFQDAISLNGHPVHRLPNTFSINFHGYSGQDILQRLPEIAATTGSACHTGSTSLSPILSAMKVPEEKGRGAVRFSLGRYTTEEMIKKALTMIKERIPLITEGGN
ncbi:cysteine desulfurase family protein [Cohnella thermotolerans]|uniref:cysteine desulfurase family protein n=1 Tax=Cohnella thermotolerans TaxID=329858 RepID=UPI000410A317|nr:cysteine desulfurase family protein [Cohnella thermotolerans]